MKKILFVLFLIANGCYTFAQTSHAVLSSRWYHPINRFDHLSTLSIIDATKPNRIDWTYCEDPKILNIYKSKNLKYSLALHPQVADSADYTTPGIRIKTLEGKPYIASWTKNFKMNNLMWGCVNNPGFQKLFYDKGIQYISLGAYAIFVDDALFNAQLKAESHNQVGCFCVYCIKKFKSYATAHGNNSLSNLKDDSIKQLIRGEIISNPKGGKVTKLYQDCQTESVVSFLKSWKSKIIAYKPGIKILCNNYRGSWNEIYSVFDGGIAEINVSDLNVPHLDSIYAIADKLKKSQLFTLASSNPYAQNYLLAYNISHNRDYIIPWDLFSPTSNNPVNRYYANMNDLNKFISLVRGNTSDLGDTSGRLELGEQLKINKYYKLGTVNSKRKIILNKVPDKTTAN